MRHARLWSILVVLLASTVALAGCAKKSDPPPADTTPTPTTVTGTTPTTPTTNVTPPPKPTVAPVKDTGQIQGQFDKSWKISLPAVSPKELAVLFNLTGVQAGAPPTAVVGLTLNGPDGKSLKAATIGLGQSANSVAWKLGPSEAQLTGDYTLKVTAQAPPAPVPTTVPSGGAAIYDLLMQVEY